MLNEAESLRAMAQAREAVADRLDREAGWYDPIYSVLVGGMIGAQAAPFPFGTLGIGVLLPVLAVLYTTEQQRTGVRMWGITPKRARWVALGLGAVCFCLMLVATWLGMQGHGLLAAIGLGAAGGVVAFAGSKLWRRVFRAELRGAA